MATAEKQLIRQRVLEYLKDKQAPVRLGSIADDLRSHNANLSRVRDSDVRRVVQSMIVTGKLDYSPDLKIELRKTATGTV